MPASGGAGYHGMTSKYAFKDAETESHGGESTRKAGKTLKFKDESPTLTERNRANSGDLIVPKNISSLKNTKLNDSSSK